MAHSKPTIVFGTAGVLALSTEDLNSMLSTLEKHNVKNLDTAYIYVCFRLSSFRAIADSYRKTARRFLARLALQASSQLTQRPLDGVMGLWESRRLLMDSMKA
jgi:hypothetical protein